MNQLITIFRIDAARALEIATEPDEVHLHDFEDMRVLRFKGELIAETIFQLYQSFHDKANQILKTDACFNRLNTICEIIHQEMNQPAPDLSIVRQL